MASFSSLLDREAIHREQRLDIGMGVLNASSLGVILFRTMIV